MALSSMIKVVVAGSSSELDAFMRELQHASVFHVTAILKKGEVPPEPGTGEPPGRFDSGLYNRLLDLKGFLDTFRVKESIWIRLF